jgi:hypothetical protein
MMRSEINEAWEATAAEVMRLIILLQSKPAWLKVRRRWEPGSILSAYREGDLTFDEAVEELKKWKKRP